jgi:hypothetical protein
MDKRIEKVDESLQFWKDLVQEFPLVGEWVAWKIDNERSVRLGEYPWLGVGNSFRLLKHMIQSLRYKNIF